MLVAEHLHTNALLVVLLTTALAVAALRAAAHLLQRARETQDRSLLARLLAEQHDTGMQSSSKPVAEREQHESSL